MDFEPFKTIDTGKMYKKQKSEMKKWKKSYELYILIIKSSALSY